MTSPHSPKFNRRMMRWRGKMLLILGCWLLFGCQPFDATSAPADAPTPAQASQSRWGQIVTIGASLQLHAPTVYLNDSMSQPQVIFSWVGVDAAGIHHDLARYQNKTLSPVITLPLDPVRPDALRLVQSSQADTLLLFYLDAYQPDGSALAETRLYSAALTATANTAEDALKLGATLISTLPTVEYTFTSNTPNGDIWLFWRSGQQLYQQAVDWLGRPQPPQKLRDDVSAFHLDTHTHTLYWIDAQTAQVFIAGVTAQGNLQDIRPYHYSPRLQAGERLINFTVAQDQTHTYLFWNRVHADGTPATDWAAYPLDSRPPIHIAPVPLGVTLIEGQKGQDLLTGFNGGFATQAKTGDQPLTWIQPTAGHQMERLVAAAQFDDQLAIIYFQSGEIIGVQPVVTLPYPLIGLPSLAIDPRLHLHLTWVESHTLAQIRYTSTDPN